MRTIDDHRRDVTALVGTISASLGSEELSITPAALTGDPAAFAQRVLASDIIAPSSLPSFDNSQMDGYAVLAADLSTATSDAPVRLPVAARVAAGDPFAEHAVGTATPVMTGAPIPAGADAVVPIERADPPVFPAFPELPALSEPSAGGMRPELAPTVGFVDPVEAGTFVRTAGSDIRSGQVLLRRGTRLGAAQLGVIAGTGATSVTVRRRPRVLLISTGHEIRDPGTELLPGQIYDANTPALTFALQSIGCAVTAVPCRSDDAADLLAIVDREAPGVDLVVTVGGVSAGTREVVRDAFGPLGVDFMKVAMQPGGPQGFGLARLSPTRELPVVSLPGNPVSALVSFEAFLRPALLTALGVAPALRESRRGRAAHPFTSPPGSHQLRRGIVHDDGTLELVGGPSSHLLHSYAESTVLVHVPIGTSDVALGDELDYWRIDG
ncbi:molybdopterin molybdotransferase MoeA [Herbiconiux daphne]|uniref:Molybdopterin molybdenumtransferase n=1 Tax=Herbiconiux daphne TaxID=2970914 RepID=A0ABT2H308_9MICO|nr:gephyrin-like molybdotransferase Glp [Herbiconiux daphne]MCS5734299.1 molybdopterin molybdotransferase MoeA [Herbiconiux daphne]